MTLSVPQRTFRGFVEPQVLPQERHKIEHVQAEMEVTVLLEQGGVVLLKLSQRSLNGPELDGTHDAVAAGYGVAGGDGDGGRGILRWGGRARR